MTVITPETSASGVYRIDGDYIIMTWPPFGTVGVVKRSGNTIIDEKTGNTWEKI